MKPLRLAPLLSLTCCGGLVAQGIHVVPAGLGNAEGQTVSLLADGRNPHRRQVVIAASELLALVDQEITALVFRRDANASPGATQSGTLNVTLSLGAAPQGPASARPDFVANLPVPITVFQGNVILPSSPDAGSRMPQWAGSDIVEITLTTPWRYAGGDLCLDLQSTSAGCSWWPVDAHRVAAPGAVQSFGSACGPRALAWGETNHVSAADLVVGGTASFQFNGAPGALALMFVGLAPLPAPMDLTFLGAPTCTLDVAPIGSLATGVSPAWTTDLDVGGMAQLPITLPTDLSFLGGELWTQWLDSDGPTFTTSNALRCRIAAAMPSLGLATIEQLGNGPIYVQPGAGPVLAFRYQ
ncbi:MAG: hypothetical protein HZB39_03970 [Planctomycetes bacterium]|nr:hypothetical protein [Planctomycetota bacterium]